MGRRQHLARLALGRSAYQDDEDTEQPVAEVSTAQQYEASDGRYVQQYNPKGRPINPAIEDFNSDLRDAKNAVLELVGVVERKDDSDQLDELRHRYHSTRREATLRREDECGEILDCMPVLFTFFAKLWPNALLQRIQVGYYDPTLSMTQILLEERRVLRTGNIKLRLATLFPGAGDLVVHLLVRLPLVLLVKQVGGRLQVWIDGRKFSRRRPNQVYATISWLVEAMLYMIDIAFLPMDLYANAQQLGLAPPLPLIPTWNYFWPRSYKSLHSLVWTPTTTTPVLRHFMSPGFLLMFHKVIHRDTQDDSTPILGAFTTFRYPTINGDKDEDPSKPLFNLPILSNPIDWLLRKQYTLRKSFLRWCGWTITHRPQDIRAHELGPHEFNTIFPTLHHPFPADLPPLPFYRSTLLAHLPAQQLARIADAFLGRLILLPFETLMLHTIASAWLSSPLTSKSLPGSMSISNLLNNPFSSRPTPSLLGTYIARLILGLAMNASIDALIFFSIYGTTRYFGVKHFDWGCKGPIGLHGTEVYRRTSSSLVSRGSYSSSIAHNRMANGETIPREDND